MFSLTVLPARGLLAPERKDSGRALVAAACRLHFNHVDSLHPPVGGKRKVSSTSNT
jgi:hypothetical protein